MINKFEGQYDFLSNFYPCSVMLYGFEYPSVEHAFQAAKSVDHKIRMEIRDAATPGIAKKLGRRVQLRPEWEQIKVKVMTRLVKKKFTHSFLKKKLLATGDQVLIEGNWWGDTFWGVCNGRGENNLGKILMKLRKEFQDEEAERNRTTKVRR